MIHLLTDGTAGLPYALANGLGIKVVPVSYTVGNRQYAEAYLDRGHDYSELIGKTNQSCTTGHPPVSIFADMFRNLSRNGDEVLCLVISSRLSGTFSSASIAAQDAPEGRVRVVDSLTTGGGLALLCQEASRLIREGKSLADCAVTLEQKRQDVGLVFSVNDMASLRRSGRLGPVRQSIGSMLNVRPILTCDDGVVNAQGVTRGTTQTIRALVDHVPEGVREMVVHHQGEKNDPTALVNALKARFPGSHIDVRGVGPTLRIHLGEGFMGIAYIT